jgi:hypothetical protein
MVAHPARDRIGNHPRRRVGCNEEAAGVLAPRDDEDDDAGVAALVTHRSGGAHAPGAADGERHVGGLVVADRGKRHDRDLGASGVAQALGLVGDGARGGGVDDAGDVGQVAGRFLGEKPAEPILRRCKRRHREL